MTLGITPVSASSFATLVCLAFASVHSDAQTFAIDPRHTFPVFEVSHYGYSLQRGRFDSVRGTIVLDRERRSGSISVIIDAASLDMGLADWTQEMKSEKFFNVAKYPHITFKSSEMTFTGDTLTSASGELTLLGITRPVTLSVARFSCGKNKFSGKEMCGADATVQVFRSEFGMKHLLPGIGDKVSILLPIEATVR